MILPIKRIINVFCFCLLPVTATTYRHYRLEASTHMRDVSQTCCVPYRLIRIEAACVLDSCQGFSFIIKMASSCAPLCSCSSDIKLAGLICFLLPLQKLRLHNGSRCCYRTFMLHKKSGTLVRVFIIGLDLVARHFRVINVSI